MRTGLKGFAQRGDRQNVLGELKGVQDKNGGRFDPLQGSIPSKEVLLALVRAVERAKQNYIPPTCPAEQRNLPFVGLWALERGKGHLLARVRETPFFLWSLTLLHTHTHTHTHTQPLSAY